MFERSKLRDRDLTKVTPERVKPPGHRDLSKQRSRGREGRREMSLQVSINSLINRPTALDSRFHLALSSGSDI